MGNTLEMFDDLMLPNEQETIKELKAQTLSLLAQKKPKEATELIVEYIIKRNHIYTTRQDEHSEMWIYHEGIYIPQGRTYIQEHCRRILDASYTTYLCNQVISKIEADTYINQEEFFKDRDPNIVPVKNGLLNIKTKTLTPFDPEQIYFNKLANPFIENEDCPAIKAFFKSLFKNEKETEVIQELFGFLLYDDYFIEKAVMFNGYGRNGKSKTLELMKRFIGVENCVEIGLEQIEEDTFAISNLFQKKANLCGDLSKTALKTSGAFKKLTGRDMLTANRKFLSPVTFTNKAKMIFSCNEIPIIYDNSDAFWMRWIFITFPFMFLPEKEINPKNALHKVADPNIIEKITSEQEMTGLLNWALEGLDRLLKNKDFSHSPSTAEVKDWWTRKSDSLKAFCMDRVDTSWDGFVSKSDFRREYALYCRENKMVAVGEKHMRHVLAVDCGAGEEQKTVDDEKGVRCWVGISLRESGETQGKQGTQGILPYSKKTNFAYRGNNGVYGVYPVSVASLFIKAKPKNNIDDLISLLGEKTINDLLKNGDIFERDDFTYALSNDVVEELI